MPLEKLQWLYVIDQCCIGGVFELNRHLADFQIGGHCDWDHFFEIAGDRIHRLKSGKFWIVRFVEFQQRTTVINLKNPAHRAAIKALEKSGINLFEFGYTLKEDSQETLENKDKQPSPIHGASMGHQCPTSNSNSNSKGTSKGTNSSTKVSNKKVKENFDRFWENTHHKTSKQDALKAFGQAFDEVRPRFSTDDEAFEFLIDAMTEFAGSPAAIPSDGITPIYPATWLRRGRYDDDRSTWHGTKPRPKRKIKYGDALS